MTALRVLLSERILRIARPGRLQPWLGPAIRGLTGGRLRAMSAGFPCANK